MPFWYSIDLLLVEELEEDGAQLEEEEREPMLLELHEQHVRLHETRGMSRICHLRFIIRY